jgi:cellulose synthase/poly-beta-1,6-N-acetylglucosamine synthase-like glycosyltransferase
MVGDREVRAGARLRSIVVFVVLTGLLIGPAFVSASAWGAFWHHALALAFVAAACWRLLVIAVAKRPSDAPALLDDALPSYSVIAPMFREAGMVDQLVAALDALNYPRDRRQVLLALEAVDEETIAAVRGRALPEGFEVVIVPPGDPQTKPRACNVALQRATGELVTIYDAEDRPDPMQLREAAARFAAGPPRLGCLQAPLRISNGGGFIPAQFANEYAAQFELLLPAMARLGLAFPLGGTSNHLRAAALRSVGGWDAYNVTEDAELGFRLVAHGWSLGVLSTATWENAPRDVAAWLPQRCRWLKGYLQTLRRQARFAVASWRVAVGMTLTVGLSLASAAIHLPTAAWLSVYVIFLLLGGPGPSLTPLDLLALGGGWSAAAASGVIGARRAGLPVRLGDVLLAVAYWPLLSFAFLHAVYRWIVEPHRWDKTEHTPWSPSPA